MRFGQDMSPRCVLFDLDGVLIDSISYHARAWQVAIHQMLRVQVSESLLLELEGRPPYNVLIEVARRYQLTIPLRGDLLNQVCAYKDQLFMNSFRFTPIPGAVDLVNTLSRFGYRLGLATSNTRVLAEAMLSRLGVQPAFVALVTAEDMEMSKPFDEPYQKLLEKLGGNPEEALVIENSPFGIQSAHAAGLLCLAITSTNEAALLDQAALVLPGLNEIQLLLEHDFQTTQGRGVWGFKGLIQHD